MAFEPLTPPYLVLRRTSHIIHRDAAALSEYIRSIAVKCTRRILEPVQPAAHSHKTKQETLLVCTTNCL